MTLMRPFSTGSSPHTRGARPSSVRARFALWDHPRIRGEHLQVLKLPLVRLGIIPAYAGSTQTSDGWGIQLWGSSPHTRGAPSCSTQVRSRSWDHPRIRGEHLATQQGFNGVQGIIPAYAGSTDYAGAMRGIERGSSPHTRGAPRTPTQSCPTRRDHPRIRGEHRLRMLKLTW